MSLSVRKPMTPMPVDDIKINPIPVDNKPPETKPIQQARTKNISLFS